MIKIFKKKPKEKKPPQLFDLNNNPIQEGDIVKSLRYDLGKSVVILNGLEYIYESIETKKKVSYVKMIDAITGNQKVLKENG